MRLASKDRSEGVGARLHRIQSLSLSSCPTRHILVYFNAATSYDTMLASKQKNMFENMWKCRRLYIVQGDLNLREFV